MASILRTLTGAMTPEEQAAIIALDIFKRQADDSVTSLYAYLAIHAVASNSERVRQHLNDNALFWNTTLRALQADLFLSLGRAFEKKSPHNVHTFLNAMRANRIAFSHAALKRRKVPTFSNNAAGLRAYMKGNRVPSPSDLRRVTDVLDKYRIAYQTKYQAIRHQVFAHSVLVHRTQMTALFSKTNIRELQRMTTFLCLLHDAFLKAFQNGGRLSVRPRRYSVARMLKRPKGKRLAKPIHEDIVVATKAALQPWALPANRR